MRNLRKLWVVLRTGGLSVAGRALFARLVFKHWRSVVFEDDVARERAPLAWPSDYLYRWYEDTAAITFGERSALEAAGAAGFLSELAQPDRMYVVWHRDEPVSFGAVLAESPQRFVLGLPEDGLLIGLCETVPEHRNRGLYSRALSETARVLRAGGATALFVEVREDNLPSIKGIEKAGFVRRGTVDAKIWFGTFVHRDGSLHRLRRGS